MFVIGITNYNKIIPVEYLYIIILYIQYFFIVYIVFIIYMSIH